MSFFEDSLLYPLRFLVRIMVLFAPILLGLLILVILITHPVFVACFTLGFLLSPFLWRHYGVFPKGIRDITMVFLQQHQLVLRKKEDTRVMLTVIKTKYIRAEERVQRKINRIRDDTRDLDYWYQEVLTRQPDKIVYYEPLGSSLFQRLKHRFIKEGG
jgi:hypothetical protein